MTHEQQVSRAFVGLADTAAEDFDPLTLFQRLVDHCTGLLATEAAGVMMRDARGGLRTMAASSERAELLELLQLQTDSGPCVDAYREARCVDVPDLTEVQDRWPELVPAALGAGFASVYTVPLRIQEHVLGAVNLFRAEPGSLPMEDRYLAQGFADVAALALMHWSNDRPRPEEILTRLQSALAFKATLEIAKGMIAETGGLTLVDAAGVLRDYAAHSKIRLTEAANALVRNDLSPAQVLGRTEDRRPS